MTPAQQRDLAACTLRHAILDMIRKGISQDAAVEALITVSAEYRAERNRATMAALQSGLDGLAQLGEVAE